MDRVTDIQWEGRDELYSRNVEVWGIPTLEVKAKLKFRGCLQKQWMRLKGTLKTKAKTGRQGLTRRRRSQLRIQHSCTQEAESSGSWLWGPCNLQLGVCVCGGKGQVMAGMVSESRQHRGATAQRLGLAAI